MGEPRIELHQDGDWVDVGELVHLIDLDGVGMDEILVRGDRDETRIPHTLYRKSPTGWTTLFSDDLIAEPRLLLDRHPELLFQTPTACLTALRDTTPKRLVVQPTRRCDRGVVVKPSTLRPIAGRLQRQADYWVLQVDELATPLPIHRELVDAIDRIHWTAAELSPTATLLVAEQQEGLKVVDWSVLGSDPERYHATPTPSISAGGTEPFWGARIAGSDIQWQRPDPKETRTFRSLGSVVRGQTQAELVGRKTKKNKKVHTITVLLERSPLGESDGMSNVLHSHYIAVGSYRGVAHPNLMQPRRLWPAAPVLP